ncbi:hypothetical protein NMG60_11031555 [Bertholletia excelsa]
MDMDEFRSILENSRVDVWTLIDTAITVASTDCEREFKRRRDAIVERLYSPVVSRCRNCSHERDDRGPNNAQPDDYRQLQEAYGRESNGREVGISPPSLAPLNRGDDDDDGYGWRRILFIKERLEDLNQSEESLVDLLSRLAHMDITFKALKETDIGRHVNRLRKHSSNEVRRLVKQLIRKWKDVVDEWVSLNTPGEVATSFVGGDGDSPYKKSVENGHHHRDMEPGRTPPYPEASTRKQRDVNEHRVDDQKLAFARRRLHENYQDAQNAKRQRMIQAMDIHDLPGPRNTFFPKNREGFEAKHW